MRNELAAACVSALLCVASALPSAAQDWLSDASYVELQDRLDRPSDGYCIDILGAGRTFRFDMPLTAHNCKAGTAPDGVIEHRPDGTLYFPAFDLCVTAMGVNGTALPGAALMAKPCFVDKPFLTATAFQTFSFGEEGRLRLAGSDLCIAVGPRSSATFSSSHRWRPLFLDDCATVPEARSRWTIAPR